MRSLPPFGEAPLRGLALLHQDENGRQRGVNLDRRRAAARRDRRSGRATPGRLP